MSYDEKKLLLKQIAEARIAHTRWLRRAQHLIEGLPVSDGMVALDPTHCEFGNWLYSDGMKYKSVLKFEQIIDKIEKCHVELHDIYLNVYKIYFVESKRFWFVSKLLASSYKEPSARQKERAKLYLYDLERCSKSLLSELTRLEKLVASIDPKQLKVFV